MESGNVPAMCQECGQGHYVNRLRNGTDRRGRETVFSRSSGCSNGLDVMSNKAKFRALIDDFESGNLDVLIGTNGFERVGFLEQVKLVGVMDADSLMGFPDFRAEERAYDMLMQVSGRSGRKGERGKVVIQLDRLCKVECISW